MPGKQKVAAPIDRPLSRAYLREFSGWSNAYPPGLSEPNSLQSIANMWVDRNGSLAVRPGLRFLSYAVTPDMDPEVDGTLGTAYDLAPVGSQEPFYTHDGKRALLFAVREVDGTVGFRAMLMSGSGFVVYPLTDPAIGFEIPQGVTTLNFTQATTHVQYLQIDNKIIAMSDAGESLRMFFVGNEKLAKRLTAITVPLWQDGHRPSVYLPSGAWINDQDYYERLNVVKNSSFENGTAYWRVSGGIGQIRSVQSDRVNGAWSMEVRSLPARTNMVHNPLISMAAGIGNWYPNKTWGNPRLSAGTSYMKIYDSKGKGLFLAYSSKITEGVVAGQKYQLAADVILGPHIDPLAYFTFYYANGAKIGTSTRVSVRETDGRWASSGVKAPAGAVAMRVSFGGINESSTSTYIKIKDVVLCKAEEVTSIFEPGDANFFWTGTPYASASVIHPPDDIYVTHADGEIRGGSAVAASIYARASTSKSYEFRIDGHDKDGKELERQSTTGTITTSWTRPSVTKAVMNALSVRVDTHMKIVGLARGEWVLLDSCLIEPGTVTVGTYFDGSFSGTGSTTHRWADPNKPHASNSIQRVQLNPLDMPPKNQTPAATTLIASGGAASNPHKMGFFYTFSNEVGETPPSKAFEIRVQRPWSNWLWETADETTGAPTGTETPNPDLAADQLVVIIPQQVYEQAVAEGAIAWHLYAFAWSDQDPVPVTAQKVATKDLYPDEATTLYSTASPWLQGGWLSLTPARKVGTHDRMLPSSLERANYSDPPRSRTGLVAGDRMILLGDPRGMATIKWSSNQLGDYTNFTANVGGGEKTLTTGNLAIPAAAVLWQNPQSVDTITILCSGVDGRSNSYYMSPATIQSGGSGTVTVMGFEETTNTPGSVSGWAAEVLNNALYRPTGDALVKSTAQNYNINHKNLTDMISDSWKDLRNKRWIMSAQLDNRLYYLVHNPYGEVLEPGAKGNEVWVHDIASKAGTWSRFLVQGSALRPVDIGDQTFMGVTMRDGFYYLDPNLRMDDYVDEDHMVRQRPIPWSFQTNMQGANRAHDAWAHLQQIAVTLGNFVGTARYGIRGWDLNGKLVDVEKQFSDTRPVEENAPAWELEDILLIRRDLKEWVFYGSSVDGLESSGHVGLVQYRYTPVSVNVGYEFGSVETFEYGADAEARSPSRYSENGIPLPYMDQRRT